MSFLYIRTKILENKLQIFFCSICLVSSIAILVQYLNLNDFCNLDFFFENRYKYFYKYGFHHFDPFQNFLDTVLDNEFFTSNHPLTLYSVFNSHTTCIADPMCFRSVIVVSNFQYMIHQFISCPRSCTKKFSP